MSISALPRLLGPIAAICLLASPVADTTMLLAMMIVLNLGLGAILVQDFRSRNQAEDDAAQLYLRRRTEPHLRAHRPMRTVEAQVLWRHAAEAHRRTRQVS